MSDAPKTLPSKEKEFDIDVKGNVTAQQFKGRFKFRVPNWGTRAQADVYRGQLNAGLETGISPLINHFHKMVALLYYTLEEYPAWWKEYGFGYNVDDLNVVEEVYNKAVEFEESWYEQIWGHKPGEKESSQDEEKQ